MNMDPNATWTCEYCGDVIPVRYGHSCPFDPRNQKQNPRESTDERIASALERIARALYRG